eukprot:COSAG01_NODE_6206_length_3796_cov_1.330268_7_plen_75_part_00
MDSLVCLPKTPISRMWLLAIVIRLGKVAAVPKMVSVEPSVAMLQQNQRPVKSTVRNRQDVAKTYALSPMWTNSQ